MARIRAHEWPRLPTECGDLCTHCGHSFQVAQARELLCIWRDGPDPATALRPEPKRRLYACEDADTIHTRIGLLRAYERRECWSRAGRPGSECWCWRAGEGGASLPCPPLSPPG